MASNDQVNYLPEWCEICDEQGYYFPEDHKRTQLVVHNKCGYEFLSTWCESCKQGFALPLKNSRQRKTWLCPTCKTEYPINSVVFQNPIGLHTADELPEDVRPEVSQRKAPPIFLPALIKKKTRLLWHRLILIFLGAIIFAGTNFYPFSEIWAGELLQTEGVVIGYGCNDDGCEDTNCSLANCFSKYSIIRFTDLYGKSQIVYDSNEQLSNPVSIKYKILRYPWSDDYKVTVTHDIGFTQALQIIIFLLAFIFILSGVSGYWFAIPRKRFKLKLRY